MLAKLGPESLPPLPRPAPAADQHRQGDAIQPYYDVSGITLFCGDCREVSEWLAGDSLLTDPPYGMKYSSGWQARPMAGDQSTEIRDEALWLWGKEKPSLVFGRWNIVRPKAARHCLIWDKGDWPGMGDLALPWGPSTEEIYVSGKGFLRPHRKASIIHYKRLVGKTKHPAEKPVGLLRELINYLPGVIVDPFAGSGTTLKAAAEVGRAAIGCELSEEYCELTVRRLEGRL